MDDHGASYSCKHSITLISICFICFKPNLWGTYIHTYIHTYIIYICIYIVLVYFCLCLCVCRHIWVFWYVLINIKWCTLKLPQLLHAWYAYESRPASIWYHDHACECVYVKVSCIPCRTFVHMYTYIYIYNITYIYIYILIISSKKRSRTLIEIFRGAKYGV